MSDMPRHESVGRLGNSRIPVLNLDTVRLAQLAIADRTESVEEAEKLMHMLGVHPSDWPDAIEDNNLEDDCVASL